VVARGGEVPADVAEELLGEAAVEEAEVPVEVRGGGGGGGGAATKVEGFRIDG
jgi:hypothetical protein